jgi:hypothetical protein
MLRPVQALGLAVALAAMSDASAQFTSDPAQPAMLAAAASEQVQPKAVALPGGGFYLSWYDNRAGGYDPWVQRFDANGVGVWPDGGVRVLDTSFSSTQDYGLTIDNAGNAVIVTRSDIGGGEKVVAQAISPAGVLLWGPTGVQLAASGSAPKAGRAGDGAAVAGWSEGNPSRARIMRLNADGTPAWASAATLNDPGAPTLPTVISSLQPGDGDSVIASAVRYSTTSFITSLKTLRAQKYSASGAALWPATTVRVFQAGSLQNGNFPPFIPDGEGGAIFAWYTTSPLMARVQWVGPAGTLKFGTDGATCADTTGLNRVDPAVTYDPATRRVFASWAENVPNTSLYGVSMQAFNETGEKLLGVAGLPLAQIETVYQMVQCRAALVNGHPTFTWTRTAPSLGNDVIWAMSTDSGGTPRWTAPVQVSAAGATGRPVATTLWTATPGCAVVWERGGTGAADIVGARLNDDGTLGPASSPADLNDDGAVNGDDLGILLGAWGTASASADLNDDGIVDADDLGIMLGAWT